MRTPIGRHRRLWHAATVAAAAGLVLLGPATPGRADGFNIAKFRTGTSTWTIPPGIFQVLIYAYGAGGGTGALNVPGGAGAFCSLILPVVPGETFQINVGGRGGDAGAPGPGATSGAGGFNGGAPGGGGNGAFGAGGGGGASDVRTAPFGLADRILVSAGAGGGGGGINAGPGGRGTAPVGADGSNGLSPLPQINALGLAVGGGGGGGGGTPTGPGGGGTGASEGPGLGAGDSGVLASGGAGGASTGIGGSGGGGGGGWFGGGGGGGSGLAAGGGGAGSSHGPCIPDQPGSSLDGVVQFFYPF